MNNKIKLILVVGCVINVCGMSFSDLIETKFRDAGIDLNNATLTNLTAIQEQYSPQQQSQNYGNMRGVLLPNRDMYNPYDNMGLI